MNESDFTSLKDLFNKSLNDLVKKVLNCFQVRFSISERIEYKEKCYYLIRQSPNFEYMNEETRCDLKKLLQPKLKFQSNPNFNPLKLSQMCRQTLVHTCSSRFNLNSCVNSLPRRIVSFLYYEQEFLDIFQY